MLRRAVFMIILLATVVVPLVAALAQKTGGG
jgi:hypothetical protein